MAKNYQVGLVITGDGKGGVKAIKATKDQLEQLNVKQKQSKGAAKETGASIKDMAGKFTAVTAVIATATAVVGGLVASLRVDAIKEMRIMSDVLKVNIQDMSEWGYAAKSLNLSNEKVGDIFKDVSDKIGDFAANGGGAAADIFDNLGVSIADIAKLSPDKQLLAIAQGLDQVQTQGEKVFYLEALAGDATRLLPLLENNAEKLRAAQKEARTLGVSLSEFDAAKVGLVAQEFDRMGGLAEGTANQLTIALAPAISAVTKGFTDSVVGIGGFQGAFETAVDMFFSGLSYMADLIKPFVVTLKTIELGWLSIASIATSAMASSADAVAKVINLSLQPFTLALAKLADGWGIILAGVAKFTRSDLIQSASDTLMNFSISTKAFKVSGGDIIAMNDAVTGAIVKSKSELEALKESKPGETIAKWWTNAKIAADEYGEAAEKAAETNGSDTGTFDIDTDKHSNDLQQLIDKVDDFGGAWSASGSVIIDTFGNIGDALNDYSKSIVEIGKLEADLAKEKQKYQIGSDDYARIEQAELSLADARTNANLKSFGTIAGAAGEMFDEQSKGREALNKAEQLFTAIEIGLSLKKAGASVIAGAAKLFEQSGWGGFAGVAGMLGVMVGLGYSGSTSGSAPASSAERQAAQGTGTVLGSDDKSESILNSIERAEDLQLDQYAELREMNSSLNDLNSNITNLVSGLVSSFGKFDADTYGGELGTLKQSGNSTTDKILESAARSNIITGALYEVIGDPLSEAIIGSFSSTKKTLLDSGISIVSQTFGEVIESGLLESQAYFDTKTKDKSFWGLKTDTTFNTEYQEVSQQLQYEMGLIFGSIGDSINSAVDVLGLDVTNSLSSFVIDLPNISFKDLSGDEIQAELEAVLSSQSDLMATYLVPGLQDFQQVGEGLYETLIRLAQEQAVFNSVLEITGNTMNSLDANETIKATQAIIEFAGGIENLQSAASTFFSEFFSDTEQFEYLQKQLNAQFAALGQTLPATADGFKDLIQGLDPLNEADQKLYAQLLLLSDQSAEYYSALEDQTAAAQDAIDAEQALARERMDAIASLSGDIEQLVSDLTSPDFDALIRAEEDRWQAQQDAAEKLYETEMSRYESALDAEKSLDEYINGLAFSDNSLLSEFQKQDLAQSNFDDAVSRAQNGDFSAVSDATSSASQLLELAKNNITGTSHNEQKAYSDLFRYVNSTLTNLQGFYADFDAPEQQIVEESPELISLREQLAASEAAAQQAENQALADLLTSQLTELSALSGDSIDSLIESFSIDLAQLGDLLSVNLTELIEVTRQGPVDAALNNGVVSVPVDNVIAFPESVATGQSSTLTTGTTTNDSNVIVELKLLREEVAALRADNNANADDAATQRDNQTATLETQTEEIQRANLREVAVS